MMGNSLLLPGAAAERAKPSRLFLAIKENLTRRANQLHIFNIARIKPAPGNRPRAFLIGSRTHFAEWSSDAYSRNSLGRLATAAANHAMLGRQAGGNMSADTIEKLITNAIHTAFIKYPEGDGGPNLDYEWIPPEQSAHITKAILLDLAANGFQIVKKGS
jgi:hypothetical protein